MFLLYAHITVICPATFFALHLHPPSCDCIMCLHTALERLLISWRKFSCRYLISWFYIHKNFHKTVTAEKLHSMCMCLLGKETGGWPAHWPQDTAATSPATTSLLLTPSRPKSTFFFSLSLLLSFMLPWFLQVLLKIS